MRDQQAVQEESWMAAEECVTDSGWGALGCSTASARGASPLVQCRLWALPLCCWVPSSAVCTASQGCPGLGRHSSAPFSSQGIMTCVASISAHEQHWQVFKLFLYLGKNSLLCSLHVKLHVGISVGSNGEGLCQQLGRGEGAVSVSPRTSGQDLCRPWCCTKPAATSPGTSGEQREAEAQQPPMLVLTADVLPSLIWQKSTLPPHPQWSCCSLKAGAVLRCHGGEHGHLILAYGR